MNVFDIDEIRKHILSYVYPPEVTVGMTIWVSKSSFHPFLTGTVAKIYDIKKKNRNYQVVIMNEDTMSKDNWYRVLTYFYPNGGDQMKVIKY